MTSSYRNINRLLLFFFLLFTGCISPFDPVIRGLEPEIVVEGYIHDQPGPYTVRINRSTSINSTSLSHDPIAGAEVLVSDDDNNSYHFAESEPGVYISDPSFRGKTGNFYKLHVKLPDGRTVESNPQELLINPGIDSLYASVEYMDEFSGSEVIQRPKLIFYTDTKSVISGPVFFRYDWVATYEVLQKRKAEDCDLKYNPPLVCYRTEYPLQYVNTLAANTLFSGDKLNRHQVAIIDPNQRLESKFSILVKQYRISRDLYDYWDFTERLLNSNGGLFDPVPGAPEGNIFYTADPGKKVLGVFEVSSISEERIFLKQSFVTKLLEHYACICQLEPYSIMFGCDQENPFWPDSCCDCSQWPNSSTAKPPFWQ